jgi:hypothetical protein
MSFIGPALYGFRHDITSLKAYPSRGIMSRIPDLFNHWRRGLTDRIVLLAGTDKGGFILTSDARRQKWTVAGPFMKGYQIYHMAFDPRDGGIFMAANHMVYGSEVARSTDFGETWRPSDSEPRFPEESGQSMEAFWHITPGRSSEPGVVYLGAAPASLWRSEDLGLTWLENESFSSHGSRSDWEPGAGGLCLRTILLDPHDEKRMYLGVSAAGFFRSDDNGQTWHLKSEGLPAALKPRYDPNAGRCVHKAALDATVPGTIYQQNHMGLYRTSNAGDSWTTMEEGLSDTFGFAMAAHPSKTGVLWIVPVQGDTFRAPSGGKMRVLKSLDGGSSWRDASSGLPSENAYAAPLREGMAVDEAEPLGVYVGMKSGTIYGSTDEGESWGVVIENLPPILSVEAAAI